jgi:hypothetical protein
MGSAGKVILSGLLDCAAAGILVYWAAVLFGKNFDSNTGSDAREACKATWNLVLTECLP